MFLRTLELAWNGDSFKHKHDREAPVDSCDHIHRDNARSDEILQFWATKILRLPIYRKRFNRTICTVQEDISAEDRLDTFVAILFAVSVACLT